MDIRSESLDARSIGGGGGGVGVGVGVGGGVVSEKSVSQNIAGSSKLNIDVGLKLAKLPVSKTGIKLAAFDWLVNIENEKYCKLYNFILSLFDSAALYLN